MNTEQTTAGLDNEGKGGVPNTGTPSNDGVTNVTPTTPLPDVGSDRLQQLETELKARTEDNNKLKSTYDKKISQTERQYQEEVERLRNEIKNTKLSTMTDEQKRKYEQDLKLEEAEQWRKKAQTYEQQMYEQQVSANYVDYFSSIGVPKEKLITNQGVETLVQSGWNGLRNVMTEYQTKLKDYETKMNPQQPQAQQTEPPQQGRSPITTNPISAAQQKTWADVIKEHGSLSNYFEKVERGDISPVPPGG
ncbi:hypothetical protein IH575_00220 [Candidatus Dojkabacteria bacterium]|nr:hypothetical protein [Candidatus Dojkabacteria bacterium]